MDTGSGAGTTVGVSRLNQSWMRIPRARRCFLLVLAPLALVLSACDWTQFGYNVSGGRSSPDTGVSQSNIASTQQLWTSTIGGSWGSSPAVAAPILYVGSTNGKVYALNTTTGQSIGPTPPAAA